MKNNQRTTTRKTKILTATKTITRVVLMAIVAINMIACSDDEENKDSNSQNNENKEIVSTFVGKAQVGDFAQEGVVLKFDFKNNSIVNLSMDSVRFASQMPFINMKVNNLTYSVSNQDTIIIGDSIAPIAMGGELPRYMITNFNGKIFSDSLTITTKCGNYQMTYKGKRR